MLAYAYLYGVTVMYIDWERDGGSRVQERERERKRGRGNDKKMNYGCQCHVSFVGCGRVETYVVRREKVM